jgi:hypothetical protein
LWERSSVEAWRFVWEARHKPTKPKSIPLRKEKPVVSQTVSFSYSLSRYFHSRYFFKDSPQKSFVPLLEFDTATRIFHQNSISSKTKATKPANKAGFVLLLAKLAIFILIT